MKKLMNALKSGRYFNFLIFPDQGAGVRFRVSRALVFFLLGVSSLGLVMLVLFIASLAEMTYKAFLAESLLDENQRLRSYNARVLEMERELGDYRDLATRVAQLAGVEKVSFERGPRLDMGMVLSQDALVQAEGKAPFLPSDESQQPIEGEGRIPYGLPLDGWISKEFIQDPKALGGPHPGIDIAAPEGREVKVTAPGVVRLAGWDDYYGNLIVVEHQNGYETYYGHNSKLVASVGEEVKRGQVIALSGNTGRSTAPHLHYEIRKDGESLNPRDYLGIKNEEQ